MPRVLFSSDLHGNYEALWSALSESNYDLWVDAGDFFSTHGRPYGGRIDPAAEIRHQVQPVKYAKLGEELVDLLRGRPLLTVPGNHDFIILSTVVQKAGGTAYSVTPRGVFLFGLHWAGFPDVRWIGGEWRYETHDARAVVEATFSKGNPDVLVTHSPPAGILDDDPATGEGYGLPELTSALVYRQHRIQWHLFGHVHERGMQDVEQLGIHFINGAGGCRIWQIQRDPGRP